MKIEMEPIGYVRNDVKDRKDVAWGEDTSSIVLDASVPEWVDRLMEHYF
ncbi:hypothetical protein [Butyrivibrio sp. XPD2002]|nr:hypothetical protein [Butyrivibrio sp. XPD2002]